MPRLQFALAERTLFTHSLPTGRTVIGRSDASDVALPSDKISRVHCFVEFQSGEWWVVDRSRHGTEVNGKTVKRRRVLGAGDVIGIGDYRATFAEDGRAEALAPTITVSRALASHEALVEVCDAAVATSKAMIRFVEGPLEGQTRTIDQPRLVMGGPGADVVLDDSLPLEAVVLRVARGRMMVEPGKVPAQLEGNRVVALTPVFEGETVRAGAHSFVAETQTVSETEREDTSFGEMVGASKPMRRLFAILRRISMHDEPVLICGESGTGKELAAHAIHKSSSRCDQPFVALNCAALPANIVESELFGHEKGSFTGAVRRQEGAFHRAKGGTLFLDEIGEMKPEVQAKLLRTLESGEVRRLGGAVVEYPDVRVIAATNRSLPNMMRSGAFREDLYFRLAVLTVRIPPLRERKEDLVGLARALLARQRRGTRLTPRAEAALSSYDWPGNVRELRNVLIRGYVLGGDLVDVKHLSFNPWAFDGQREDPPEEDPERVSLCEAMGRHDGNQSRAARDLGIPRSTLIYKLRRMGITEDDWE